MPEWPVHQQVALHKVPFGIHQVLCQLEAPLAVNHQWQSPAKASFKLAFLMLHWVLKVNCVSLAIFKEFHLLLGSFQRAPSVIPRD